MRAASTKREVPHKAAHAGGIHEKRPSCLRFLFNALRFFRAHGVKVQRVMTDNGASFRSFRYARALRQHEQGHVQFGRQAAQSIDQGIAALPEAPDCPTLERQANALGHRLLAAQAAQEKAYDRDTRHGATQGAQVD